MITQIYYIGTGALNAMFTLRSTRRTDDAFANMFIPDNYLCNLAAAGEAGEELAISKARNYVDAMRERIGETDDFKIEFGGIWEDACNARRGKLSVRDTAAIETIEAGRFPFGKNAGKRIEDAEFGYVLYFADMMTKTENPVTYALAAACQGVALEKGYIAKREAAAVAKREADELSAHIGTIGERRDFTGEIVSVFFKDDGFGGFHTTKIRCGDDLVTYYGKQIGERGATVTMKATIKRHDEYKGIKTTVVNRPKLAD